MKAAAMGIATMGIDVAIERGLDIVGLDDSLRVVLGPEKSQLRDLPELTRQTEPQVIAIDSPPEWGPTGKARRIEKQLQALGISTNRTVDWFRTPGTRPSPGHPHTNKRVQGTGIREPELGNYLR